MDKPEESAISAFRTQKPAAPVQHLFKQDPWTDSKPLESVQEVHVLKPRFQRFLRTTAPPGELLYAKIYDDNNVFALAGEVPKAKG